MDENGNRKRRIARIGRMTNSKEATKLSGDEGINIDRSLVRDIMESMDKSQSVLSYHQLQEFRSKDKSISTNNSVSSSSGKQNTKISSTKQIKKLDSGKKNPLMAKCLQTMKNIKKNRSMPKPRAHVGPSQTPISRLQSNNLCNNQIVSNITVNHKEYPRKSSDNSKKNRCSPEVNKSLKKSKTAHSVDKSRDTNASQTSFDKDPKPLSDAGSDSDNEFEKFIQKHHPVNRVRRKKKNNKSKRKKSKHLSCAKKVAKVTSKTLSDSEESMENDEVDHNTDHEILREEITSKKFKKISDYDDSDMDYHVNDSCTMNYDSSSEDENFVKKSSNTEKVIDSNVNRLVTFPDQKSSVISSSISTHEPEDSPSYCDILKAKCKIPCYVRLKRDPLLDKKAASLYVDNSPVSNTVSVSNSNDDEDDCIIILNKTSTINFADQNSRNNTTALEKNSNEKIIFNSNYLELQIEKNSNEKSAESILDHRNAEKGVSNVTASRKSLCDTEKDECLKIVTTKSISVVNPESREMTSVPNNEINGDEATTATEKQMFNVQILSVKSLNDTDVIVLSDDSEEKDEAVSTSNETEERVDEDSDVEIICLDSSIVREESSVNENITHDKNKVNGPMKENSSSSAQPLASVEQDCIILDDLDLPSENTTAKNIDMVPSSPLVNVTSNKTTNSSKNEISSDKESILKTLGTIDFNCIKKVLSATTVTDPLKESAPARAFNSFSDNIKVSQRAPDSTLAKQKLSQNTCHSQEQSAIDATVAPVRSVDVGNKVNSQSSSAVETQEKHSKSVKNSNDLRNIKSDSEDVSSSKKLNSDKSSSNVSDKKSTVYIKPSTLKLEPKPLVSKDKEIEIVAISHKTKPNALGNSQKNQQLVPTCTKMESFANPADELDFIAAKAIKDLNQIEKDSIVPLLELYREEYEKYMNIKCTEENVTAGLKLLEDKQAKKLLAISSSIKNIVQKDLCFHKINNEYGSKRNKLKNVIKSDSAEKNESVEAIKKPSDTSIGSYPDIEKDDKVKIFNQSVVKTASEYLKTAGPSSSQEVYNHLINSVCAECGKHAVAACLGCAKVYYCSENCGMTHWNKGHYETCMR